MAPHPQIMTIIVIFKERQVIVPLRRARRGCESRADPAEEGEGKEGLVPERAAGCPRPYAPLWTQVRDGLATPHLTAAVSG